MSTLKPTNPAALTYTLQHVHNFTNENRGEVFTTDRHKKFSVSYHLSLKFLFIFKTYMDMYQPFTGKVQPSKKHFLLLKSPTHTRVDVKVLYASYMIINKELQKYTSLQTEPLQEKQTDMEWYKKTETS